MPTKKPRVQAILEEEKYKKFMKICKIEERSESKLAGIAITKYIQEYEAEHGEIVTQLPPPRMNYQKIRPSALRIKGELSDNLKPRMASGPLTRGKGAGREAS